ncbi:general substrate transporter [Choiromyces venosus 120613-1]|uniref:General substrate transporter n=1 Tax=Choiromyces venosus 120613-1 TaxID=1336337 RepID=A0A3N4JEN3_9PEZI|nr:general substrate transporter [Choiromyces venosus 120613-1]
MATYTLTDLDGRRLTAAGTDKAAIIRRQALAGPSGPAGLIQNGKEGVFSGVCEFVALERLYFSPLTTVLPQFVQEYAVSDRTKRAGLRVLILELGAWTGTIYSGVLAERISRKYTILVNVVIFCIGEIPRTFRGGRFITDMGVGSLSMTVPMYNAEIAPPEVRGSLVGLQQLAITFGIIVSFWYVRPFSPEIDYGTNYIGGTGQGQKDTAWVLPLALQFVPAVILGVGIFPMPFSPRRLAHRDCEEQAIDVLASLRGLTWDRELIDLGFLEIQSRGMFEKRTEAEKFPHLKRTDTWSYIKLEALSFASLFQTWSVFCRVMVSTVILYYAPSIFAQLGMSNNTTSLLATGVVGIAMFLATLSYASYQTLRAASVMYIDSLGRKRVLFVGAVGVALPMATHRAAGWGAISMVWLFVIHFGYSWGPCAWILPVLNILVAIEIAEVWPLNVRAKGIALGASSTPANSWQNNFTIGPVTPDMLERMKWGTYVFFGIFTMLGAGFILFLVPETKLLSLEEMDVIFGSEGIAAAEVERQAEINRGVGLDLALERFDAGLPGNSSKHSVDEKEKPVNLLDEKEKA